MIISERLHAIRKASKLTQQEFADLVGVTKSTISAYELGSATPSFTVLYKICSLFQVKADFLLGLDQEHFISIEGLNEKQKESIESIVKLMQNKEK